MNLWRLIIGKALESEEIKQERLTKRRGYAVLAADALSSTAYATEEILRVLILTGAVGLLMTINISIAIVALLLIVGASYYRIIFTYPGGGGAYVVAKNNLGPIPSAIAGASLLVDYALTVAVSNCAAAAALTSALPDLIPYQELIAIALVIFVTVVNLRGLRESSRLFMIPAYLFVLVYGGMICFGAFQAMTGGLPKMEPAIAHLTTNSSFQILSLFLVLKAFASGSAALTGIEAISHGVQTFRPPQARNAAVVLWMMILSLAFLFLGTGFLAYWLGVVPNNQQTVVSQIARGLFGSSPFFYAVQFFTMIILILAANTAFTAFPRLCSLLAQDRYLPRQLGNLGDRLVYSNGILVLGVIAIFLILAFRADVHGLIPLYMVGVFLTFTISQSGMVKYWLRNRQGRWWFHLTVNGLGAICTLVVGFIVMAVKFADGAWITCCAIPILVFVMFSIYRHYLEFGRQLALTNAKPPKPFTHHKVVIPVSDVHRGVLEAVRYATSISKDVSAVYVDLGDPARLARFQASWKEWVPDVPIEILPSPYRSVIQPILEYMDKLRDETDSDTAVTVVIPEFVPVKWWHQLLHNQTALFLKFSLLFHRRLKRRYKVLADVPYYLRR